MNETALDLSGVKAREYMKRYGVTPTTLAAMWNVRRSAIYKLQGGRAKLADRASDVKMVAERMGYFGHVVRPPAEYGPVGVDIGGGNAD